MKSADASGSAGSEHHGADDASLSPSTKTRPTASAQLEELLGYPWPFPGRPPRHDLSTWTVTDDWPNPVMVTDAEIEVFERWFGDLFDELSS
ncbi:hypothetical protein [Aliihoeflea sp. 40Bstr573]|jgi:hypothetical protein|uniref:hypothetical protein n=1 Tax=Aliihoeflea sp. 40Bstr573 TaxID=2696467 RepID=UPI002094EA95|nr:hypothetical protein [Aliihoeflea sp. 40Bstr573]MCO6387098.1 hypothetical protein [Aliihoeflea sp. 40Bstr573]